MILNRDKIYRIPKMAETMTQAEIAREFHVHLQTIVYWVKRLRAGGYTVPSKKGKRALKL